MRDEHKDVLIAVYLYEDLAQKDFDAVLKVAEDKEITVDGVVLVRKDADGEVEVRETRDHLGRKGAKIGGGAGLVVGLFAPPLLGGVIAVYEAYGHDAVDAALANAVKKSVARIDGTSAKELKGGLALAQAGMGG